MKQGQNKPLEEDEVAFLDTVAQQGVEHERAQRAAVDREVQSFQVSDTQTAAFAVDWCAGANARDGGTVDARAGPLAESARTSCCADESSVACRSLGAETASVGDVEACHCGNLKGAIENHFALAMQCGDH